MTPEEMQAILQSNAKAIASNSTMIAASRRETEALYQLASELVRDRAVMYEILSGLNQDRVSLHENLASMAENVAKIAESVSRGNQ